MKKNRSKYQQGKRKLDSARLHYSIVYSKNMNKGTGSEQV